MATWQLGYSLIRECQNKISCMHLLLLLEQFDQTKTGPSSFTEEVNLSIRTPATLAGAV